MFYYVERSKELRKPHKKKSHKLTSGKYVDQDQPQLNCAGNQLGFVGFEVFTAVVMKSIIFCDMTPCSPLSFNRRFGGTYRLHLQGRRNRFSKLTQRTTRRHIPEDDTLQLGFGCENAYSEQPALHFLYTLSPVLLRKVSLEKLLFKDMEIMVSIHGIFEKNWPSNTVSWNSKHPRHFLKYNGVSTTLYGFSVAHTYIFYLLT
jgi:hypothetical protein